MLAPCRVLPALAFALLAGTVTAQQKNDAGIGTVKRSWDASNPPAVRDALIIGVCYLNGEYFVSGRGDGAQRLVYVYDAGANLLRQFAPSAVQVTANGARDMATDGNSIIAGSAIGVVAFDTNGATVATVQALNGPQTVTLPITGPAFPLCGNLFRGCAYDPAGNGGNGSLWVSNQSATFSLDLFEIDLQGNILRQIPNQGWEAYGLALDPMSGNLWVSSLIDPGNANGGPIFELDPTTGMPTGATFPQAHTDFHGGLDGITGGDPGSYNSHFDLVAVNQSEPDTIAIHRVHLYRGLHGKDEAFLEGGINGVPFAVGNIGQFAAGSALSFQINPGIPLNTGSFAWIILNLSDDALCDAVTSIPIPGLPQPFPELRAQNVASNPRSTFAVVLPTSVGTVHNAVIPPGIFSDFDVIRMQGLYFDLTLAGTGVTLPFVATSEVFTNHFDEASALILVEAVGINSFVNVTPGLPQPPTGFWRVHNIGGPNILEVTFDFLRSTNWQHLDGDLRWDLDEANMGDRFTAGNSSDPLCRGTYRNGSDVTTGLVFDASNYPPFPCTPTPNSGFIAVNPSNPDPAVNNSLGLRFRFTDFGPGEIFEFDCDTDGGPGTDGASMAGMFIEVKLADGRTLCGELRIDPVLPSRSVWGAR